jgi:hypothetical protein
MRKFLLVSASLGALSLIPAIGFAAEIVVEPEVHTWVMEQPEASVTLPGDITIGMPLPGSVKAVEVPKYKKYKYTYINHKRVLVDAATGKVIAVY